MSRLGVCEWWAVGLALGLLSHPAAFTQPGRPTSPQDAAAVPFAQEYGSPVFRDMTEHAGVSFRHEHGGRGEKHLPETMGSGVAWLDYDGDGLWDLYLVDSGLLPGSSSAADPGAVGSRSGEPARGQNVLYRGLGGGRFGKVSGAGVGDSGYGMGVAVADYDGDGWPDVLVTNFGPNALYRNNGDGTFTDVTEVAGVGDPRWSASAAWGDLDLDGFPDLYVTSYLAYDVANAPHCGVVHKQLRSYCHPRLFGGQTDLLYRNRGDGSLEELSVAAGVANAAEGKGLGVFMGDLDDDGLPDIYVANDTARNFFYLNRGGFRFDDQSLIAGVGYGEGGEAQAGMGVDFGDLDGDGRMEIVVTNFADEPNNLYRPYDTSLFLDETYLLGLGRSSFGRLGFGVVIVDMDGDGDQDLAVANGHLGNAFDVAEELTPAQPNQVFINRLTELRAEAIAAGKPVVRAPEVAGSGAAGMQGSGWRPEGGLLIDGSAAAGEPITRAAVSRGLAYGDMGGDGWPDLVVTNSNAPAELLGNVTEAAHSRLVLRLRGRVANREALGARVWVTPLRGGAEGAWEGSVGFPQLYEVKSASSYLSQNATDLYVGLGAATTAAVTVQWPGGERERVGELEAGQLVLIVEGRGVVGTAPLAERQVGGAR